jgi:hypothetical protein
LSKFKTARRERKLFDYRRECDRCNWRGWKRSELQREEQTNLLVCPPCLDKKVEQFEPNTIKVFDGRRVID